MDNITIKKIQLLHPSVRQKTLDDYLIVNNNLLGKNIRLRFSNTYRSFEEQDNLYAIGRTVKGKRVTNGKGGLSIHNYGLAFDIVLLIDKDNNGTFETASWDTLSESDNDGKPDWLEIVEYFKDRGWIWGGDWKSFPDYPHFEKTFGYTPQQLLAKHNAGDVFTEIIEGKIYKGINL